MTLAIILAAFCLLGWIRSELHAQLKIDKAYRLGVMMGYAEAGQRDSVDASLGAAVREQSRQLGKADLQ